MRDKRVWIEEDRDRPVIGGRMPKSVELFAGGGGMALGMYMAGVEHEQLVEWDPRACDILRANAERNPQIWKRENVREMDVRKWLMSSHDLDLEGIDIIAGGPPCQPFSLSGKREGRADERNMFPAAIQAVRQFKPKAFVFENVPGLLRAAALPYYEYIERQLRKPEIVCREGENWLEHSARIKHSDEFGLVYRVYRQTINAADLGVPQLRRRVFLVGIRSDIPGADNWQEIPRSYSQDALLYAQWISGDYWQEHGIEPPEIPENLRARVQKIPIMETLYGQGERWRTVRDAISKFPEPEDYREAPGVINHWGIPGARVYKGHTGSWIDWPAKTIKAGVHGVCGGEAMIRFSDDIFRYLTIREAAEIQSFPADYEFPGSRTAMMRAIGNAVAVDVAAAIGRRLLNLIGAGSPAEK
jgi:DNA (cytosine-5)-methyltransferase 1